MFYVSPISEPRKFTIEHRGEHYSKFYVNEKKKLDGREDGPLELRERDHAEFSLRSTSVQDNKVEVKVWEEIPCYVKLSSGKIFKRSYLALNEENCSTLRVNSLDKNPNKILLQFKLERPIDP